MTSFRRFELRARNVPAATAFYTAVFGAHPSELEAEGIRIVPLPESLPRHLPAHWLGQLPVETLERALARWVECGGTRLGPVQRRARGQEVATVRDPGGATVMLATKCRSPLATRVVWHQLDTKALTGATTCYGAIFGWRFTDKFELDGATVGQLFAFGPDGEDAGAVVDLSARPSVHPHWVFHFRVPALDTALDAVRAGGGTVLNVAELPNGDRFAVCDDPQGGGFALRQA